jgi:hypothetical protein
MVLLIYVPGMLLPILGLPSPQFICTLFCALQWINLTLDTGSPHMYTYMLGQRKKALSKSKTM